MSNIDLNVLINCFRRLKFLKPNNRRFYINVLNKEKLTKIANLHTPFLLMPEFLSYINVKNATSKLHGSYMNDA